MYKFKTPKECEFCERLPAGLDYAGSIGAWTGIYSFREDFPDFIAVCKAIEEDIVERERAYQQDEAAYEKYLIDSAEDYLMGDSLRA